MLSKLAQRIWTLLPYRARVFAIRSTQDKFTVSVVALVLNERGEVLILDHFLRSGPSWGLPGGFVDRGESAEDAIRRELLEETGLEISGLSLVEVRTIKRHIEILFRANGSGEPVPGGREVRAAKWFDKENLPEEMYAHQRDAIKKALEIA